MTVEERLKLALQDLEGDMHSGEDLDQSLASVALQYGFREEVLKVRAERAFGNLGSACRRLRTEAKISYQERGLRDEAFEFAEGVFAKYGVQPTPVLDEFLSEIGEKRGITFRDIILTQNWALKRFKTDAEIMKARSYATARLRQLYRDSHVA